MSKKFKIGDVVVCTSDGPSSCFTLGRIYVVARYVSESRMGLSEDDRGSTTNGWGQENFELADSEVAKVVFGVRPK